MEEREITLDDLKRMAMAMAQKIPEIDCPECCDCGWTYQYVELSAGLYQDEWEWACLSDTIVRYRLARQSAKKESG
jgi:hypothetical protein